MGNAFPTVSANRSATRAIGPPDAADVSTADAVVVAANGSLSPTTRLCAVCYRAEPIHRRCWQRADLVDCPSHHVPFLTQCPACQTALRLPSLWALGRCERCWLPFEQMRATSESEEA